jgi:3-methylfumaryl-CoA hydratase
MSEIDLDMLEEWIGKTETVEDVITLAPARSISALLDHENQPKVGDELPLLWTWLYFLPTPRQSLMGADGHPRKGGFLPPVPLPRRMRAGGRFTYESPLRIGDSACQKQTVKDIKIKEGRTGTLVFVNIQHEIFVGDRRSMVEEMNLVYRDYPVPGTPPPPAIEPPGGPEWILEIIPDPVMLFRYSALTQNTHRIHYDREYAMDEESYQGLVVQAPLTATLLMDFLWRSLPGVRVKHVKFRATRPLFDGKPIRLEGKRDGKEVLLWAVDSEGALAMMVEVALA